MKEREYANAKEQEAVETAEEVMLLGLWAITETKGRLTYGNAIAVISEVSSLPLILSVVCVISLKKDGFLVEGYDEKGPHIVITDSGKEVIERYKAKYPDKHKEFSGLVNAEKLEKSAPAGDK